MKKYFVFVCAIILSACAYRSPETSFYTLDHAHESSIPISNKKITLDIGRIRVPEYIDRPQIVTTDGVTVSVDQENRWVESLASMIQRLVASDISNMLPNATIKNNDFVGKAGQYAVFIEITRLDGALPGDVHMNAIYSILADSGETIKTRRVEYSEKCDNSYAAYAAAISSLVKNMSHDIAVDVSKLEK